MFNWLLSKPAIVIDLILGGILIAFGLYFWISHRELNQLTKEVEQKTIQVKQNEAVIRSLNDRLVLIQKLNDNFNKSINVIRQNQKDAQMSLQAFDLTNKSKRDPKQAELFINQRNAQILDNLNNLSRTIGEIAK